MAKINNFDNDTASYWRMKRKVLQTQDTCTLLEPIWNISSFLVNWPYKFSFGKVDYYRFGSKYWKYSKRMYVILIFLRNMYYLNLLSFLTNFNFNCHLFVSLFWSCWLWVFNTIQLKKQFQIKGHNQGNWSVVKGLHLKGSDFYLSVWLGVYIAYTYWTPN